MGLLDRAAALDRRLLGRWWSAAGRRDRSIRYFWVGPLVAVVVALVAVWCALTGRESAAVTLATTAFGLALFQGFIAGYFFALRCQQDGRRPLWDQG